jgi:hypothetical protein
MQVKQYGLNRIRGVTFYLEKLQEASNVEVSNGVCLLVNFNIFSYVQSKVNPIFEKSWALVSFGPSAVI